MAVDLLIPSLAAFSGGSIVAARHYLRHRFASHEDRFMALYGLEAWEDSNMYLALRCDPAQDGALKEAFRARLEARLRARDPALRLLQEHVEQRAGDLDFVHDDALPVETLFAPRRGVWFDLSEPGRIEVVWNHMQTDGVGMWGALRPLFDENPPLVPYREVRPPPPFLPEVLSLPRVASRLGWRGSLHPFMREEVSQGFEVWPGEPLRALRDAHGARFNLLTTALVARSVFARHPEVDRLQLGMTVFFPFLQARNRYGVLTVKVRRGPLGELVDTISRQVRFPLLAWGTSSATSSLLRVLPDRTFLDVVGYYRRQIDVLVSNLPVGTRPIQLDGVDVQVSCHCDELTVPYYFLLVGTKRELHVSWSARFEEPEGFASLSHATSP